MTTGKLYIIPVLLGGDNIAELIPEGTLQIIKQLRHFIVENEKSARKFLKLAGCIDQKELQIQELDKHEQNVDYQGFLLLAVNGIDIGLLSEAGAPAVADPGAAIVNAAHQLQIKVRPLTGPSSLLLALMASGLNGQSFCFHGYLPIEKEARIKKLGLLEKDARMRNQTQLFIETPYRNNQLLKDLIEILSPSTKLCIACNISLPDEYIFTRSIASWKKQLPELNKKPCVFLLL